MGFPHAGLFVCVTVRRCVQPAIRLLTRRAIRPAHCGSTRTSLQRRFPCSRPARQSPSATQNLGRTDAYARTASPIASQQVFRSLAPCCRYANRRWLEHDEAADAAFCSIALDGSECPSTTRKAITNGLGPDSLHCLQGGRVRHRHVLCHQVALRPREEGKRRNQQASKLAWTGTGRVEVGADGWEGLGCINPSKCKPIQLGRSALPRP